MNVEWVWESAAAMWGLGVLADAAVKGTVLLGLAWGVTGVMRRGSAAVRHWVWMTAMGGLVVLPVLGVVIPGWAVLPKWMEFSIHGSPVVPSTVTESVQFMPMAASMNLATPAEASGPAWKISVPWAMVVAWGAGAAATMLPVVLGMLGIRRWRRSEVAVPEPQWRELLGRLALMSGVTRKVELRRNVRCAVPLTYGVWRPVIVLPAEEADWTAERRRMALLHELAHIRRWDFLTQLLARCVRAVYWFDPLAWVAVAQGQAECERACDDHVLTAGTKPSTYATTLMEYAAPPVRGRRVPAGALAMARASTLEGRLLAILDAARNRRGVTWRAGLGVLAVVAGLSVGLGMLRAQTSETRPTTRSAEVGGSGRLELRPDTVMPGALAATKSAEDGEYYILGNVKRPGVYSNLKRGANGEVTGETVTIAQAVAMAEIEGAADALDVTLIRRIEDGTKELSQTFAWEDLSKSGVDDTGLRQPVRHNDLLVVKPRATARGAGGGTTTGTASTRRVELRSDTVMLMGGTMRTATGPGTATATGAAGTAPGQTTVEYVQLRNSDARDVAALINAMFAPARANPTEKGQQKLIAEFDTRTNTVVLSGPAELVTQAKRIIDNAEAIKAPDLPNTTVFFIANLKAAKAAEVSAKLNERFATTQSGVSTGPARPGRSGDGRVSGNTHSVANGDTNSLLITTDRSHEEEIRALIKALDDAAASAAASMP